MSLFQRIFRRPDYTSDVTNFIEELRTAQPDLEARQRAGRALLWDKHVSSEASDEFRAAQIRQKPYVYQNNVK